MKKNEQSRTALGAVVIRAVHQLIDDDPRILEDSVSVGLLNSENIAQIQADPRRYRTPQAKVLRSHLVLRSRYAEDELCDAAKCGIRQFLNLGAGHDTFACRQPAWAQQIQILEIDHPASQLAKRRRFAEHQVKFPGNVSFLPIDLERTDLCGALAASALNLKERLFVSCLGVLSYLRPETVRRIFKSLSRLAPESRIMMSFASKDLAGEESPVARRSTAQGELWLTYFTEENLGKELKRSGFHEVKFLKPAEAADRYYRGRTDLPPPKKVRLCMVYI